MAVFDEHLSRLWAEKPQRPAIHNQRPLFQPHMSACEPMTPTKSSSGFREPAFLQSTTKVADNSQSSTPPSTLRSRLFAHHRSIRTSPPIDSTRRPMQLLTLFIFIGYVSWMPHAVDGKPITIINAPQPSLPVTTIPTPAAQPLDGCSNLTNESSLKLALCALIRQARNNQYLIDAQVDTYVRGAWNGMYADFTSLDSEWKGHEIPSYLLVDHKIVRDVAVPKNPAELKPFLDDATIRVKRIVVLLEYAIGRAAKQHTQRPFVQKLHSYAKTLVIELEAALRAAGFKSPYVGGYMPAPNSSQLQLLKLEYLLVREFRDQLTYIIDGVAAFMPSGTPDA